MRCRWGVRAQLNNYCNDSHTPCGRPAVAAADLEGFAHSAAAEGKKRPQACTHVYQLSAQRVRNDFRMRTRVYGLSAQ